MFPEKSKTNDENSSETRSDTQTQGSKGFTALENESNLSFLSEDSETKGFVSVLTGMWHEVLEYFANRNEENML